MLIPIKKLLKQVYYAFHQTYFRLKGGKIECKVCSFKADRLSSDTWHPYSICPRCGSSIRQRLLMQVLIEHPEFNRIRILSGKRILHFAPEKILRDKIRVNASDYRTADFFAEGYYYPDIDFNLDISSMPSIATESYDVLIACDVLEHVPDDRKALLEVYRILSKGGYCIFTVPQKDQLIVTFEDKTVTDPMERERVFGQRDHLRIYGDDFADLIQQAGFALSIIDASFFSEEVIEKNVLFPPILSSNPLATNHRKIFIGRKG